MRRMPNLMKLAFAISFCFIFGLLFGFFRIPLIGTMYNRIAIDDGNHGNREGPKVRYIPQVVGEPVTFMITAPPKEIKTMKPPVKVDTRLSLQDEIGPPLLHLVHDAHYGHLPRNRIPTKSEEVRYRELVKVIVRQQDMFINISTVMPRSLAKVQTEKYHGHRSISRSHIQLAVGTTHSPGKEHKSSLGKMIPPGNNQNRWNGRYKQRLPIKSTVSMKEYFRENFIATYQTKEFDLKDDKKTYTLKYSPTFKCLLEGTDFIKTQMQKNKECSCQPGWYGMACSMPSVVWNSDYPYEYGVAILDTPRRIIYGMPFNHEFDLLDAKMHELYDTVDVWLILESNYTASGQKKPRRLKQRLEEGFLREFQDKIVYISLDYFPKEAYINGWIIDALLRNYIGYVGLEKILKNVRPDDIFISMDADEIPTREALLFLKLHIGYPEPIGFKMRHNIYGFFWQGKEEDAISEIYGAVSIALLSSVLNGNVYPIRSIKNGIFKDATKLNRYKREFGGRIRPWSFGKFDQPSGWHCSWCFTPEGIQYKMLSAHASDSPRWGTITGKTNINYIQRLVSRGIWFNNEGRFAPVDRLDAFYAPRWMTKHAERFDYLLNNRRSHS